MIKKIAYVCRWPMETKDGVSQKIHNQMAAWEKLGIEVRLFCRSPTVQCDIPEKDIYAMQHPFAFWRKYKHITRAIKEFDPDVIYSRYEIPTVFSMGLASLFNKRVVIEINSNDMQELKLLTKLNPVHYLPRLFVNFLFRSLVFANCGCIVTHTHELAKSRLFTKYNKPVIVAPNSILLDNIPLIKENEISEKPYGLLFLGSSGQPWQGLDKVQDLAEQLGEDYHIHVGMEGVQPRTEGNITYHGFLSPAQYRQIASKCIAGIGTLALYRKKMQEVNAIKVREFIAMGLPVIIAHDDTAFMDSCPDWVLQIPNKETNINSTTLLSIRNFLERMRCIVVPHAESARYIDSAILEPLRIENIRRCLEL